MPAATIAVDSPHGRSDVMQEAGGAEARSHSCDHAALAEAGGLVTESVTAALVFCIQQQSRLQADDFVVF